MKTKKDESKKTEKQGITKDSTLAEILQIEGADRVLAEHHLPCMGCPMAGFEMGMLKIGDVCKSYGIDLDKILNDLNKLVKSKK